MPSDRAVALVTGASSGIGASYATQLAAQGYDLVLVARRRDRLEELARTISTNSEVLPADLTKPDALAAVEARAARDDLDVLVNNAGFAGYRPFVELDPRVADDLLELHVRVVTRLTRAALPGMIQRHRGAIINVSSLLSQSASIPPNPLPYRAVYAAGKAYVVTFTQALAGEVKDSGVRLQVCLPGVVATEFHDDLRIDRNRLAAMAAQPNDIVAASLSALEPGELICVPGLEDPALIDQLVRAQRALMEAGNRPQIAARYGAASPRR
jgi:uncharacterized protein